MYKYIKLDQLPKVTKKDRYVDFDEIFLLVTMLKFIRILLAIVAYHDYEICQIDVKIVFLNRNVQKDMYVAQLESFESKEFFNKVCQL